MFAELLYTLIYYGTLWLFCITLWKYYIESLKDKENNLPLPPGTVGLPFIGETFHMLFQGWKFYTSRRQKHGHIYKTHIMGRPTIRVWGTDNIQQILKNEEMLVTMAWPRSSIEIVGNKSVVASTRRDHSTRRAQVGRAFTTRAVQSYSTNLERIIKSWVLDRCQEVNVTKALQETRILSFKASASALLGMQLTETQMNRLMSNMEVMTSNFFTLPVNIPGTGFNQAMNAREEVLSVIREIIDAKYKADNTNQGDALSILLFLVDAGELKQNELEDSLIEGLFSAQNGLPSLCCSTLVHLAKYPEVVSKILEELEDFGLLDSDASLTLETLKHLPYLEQVWKEITRISPPFGGGFRQAIKTFELEGYQIPAGWTVLYSIRDNHEAEENFHLHADFNPDRWEHMKSNAAWMPFGGNGIRTRPSMMNEYTRSHAPVQDYGILVYSDVSVSTSE